MTKQVFTPEQKARRAELARERRANRTPEQKARSNELDKERHANKTPEQRVCSNEGARKRSANRTPEQVAVDKAKRKEYYTDPVNKAKRKEYNKDYHSDPINKARQKLLMAESDHLRLYGFGLQETIDKFGTICNCCGYDCKSTQPLHTDHCHETGVIRGRICWEVNTSLGKLGDTVEGLERAIKYLRGGAIGNTKSSYGLPFMRFVGRGSNL